MSRVFRTTVCGIVYVYAVIFVVLPGRGSDWTLLKGRYSDVLINIKKGEVSGCTSRRMDDPGRLAASSFLFSGGGSVWQLDHDCLTNLETGATCRIPGRSLLPAAAIGRDLEGRKAEGYLQIPVISGFELYQFSSGEWFQVPFQHDVKWNDGVVVSLPTLIPATHGYLAVDANSIRRLVGNQWQDIVRSEGARYLDGQWVAGTRWVSLAISEVTPGDLNSFAVRVISVDRKTGAVAMDHREPGILKQAYADESGRVVTEYVNASIIAALFQRKQMRLRVHDPAKDVVTERVVDLTHKRRHVYPMRTESGKLVFLVHCKDGFVYQVDVETGTRRRLLNEVSYAYQFARTGDQIRILDPGFNPVGTVSLLSAD